MTGYVPLHHAFASLESVAEQYRALLERAGGDDVVFSYRERDLRRLVDCIDAVLAAGTGPRGVGTIMLDNFSLEDLRAGVAAIAGRTIVEASGGVNLDTVAAIAATGVDVVSVGALTHSARALDLGLDVRVEA